ncbi:MAG: hypothetical protein A2Y73_02495 [Chloroflexi bacterium RBG_13_56_8]|nr:MAG: hypothetical protein A2Y73_02495 [Chloroflexi bacterium RBG_13_56_8]
MSTIITLCTDFGTQDGYVAAMKGVILSIAPQARIVDITHEVARQRVGEGAFVFYSACRYFPVETIHLVVVDPKVGSARRALAVRTANYRFVAPDNGILSYVLRKDPPLEIVSLTRKAYWREAVSHTFHGRDIFAPVAAHLANGVSLTKLGEPIDDLVWLDAPQPAQHADGSISGHVIHIDRFGNVITNIPAEMLTSRRDWRVWVGNASVTGLSTTYASGEPGDLIALIGSHGNLEVAIREGDAARAAGVGVGAEVWVR